MKTKKVFEEDKYLSKLQSEILEVIPEKEDIVLLILKDTIFFPGGGGQSHDIGNLWISDDASFDVIEVFEKDGEIFHRIRTGTLSGTRSDSNQSDSDSNPPHSGLQPGLNSFPLQPGLKCFMELDWNRRFDNMQRHCGEHILSGVFYELYGGVNRGFHMGDDYMTIDISLEDNPEYVNLKEMTWDMVMAAELKTNQIIWKDLPVTAYHFDTKEEAEKIPMRKALAIDEDITIVTIGDLSHPADSVACCGTHPATTGQVGMLKIYKVEPNKGMFRIYFDAGERAFMGYRRRFDILTRLEKDLSAGVPDLLDKYAAKQEKQKEARDRLFHLTKSVQEAEKERIAKSINDESESEQNGDIFEYSILTVDDVIEIGRSLEGRIPGILYLIHQPSLTLLVFSDKHDCGKLVKENASVFNGKGGGNQKFARAIFTRRDDLDMFITGVKNLLR